MVSPTRTLALAASIAMLISVCGFSSDAPETPAADIIVTVAAAYEPLAALHGRRALSKRRAVGAHSRGQGRAAVEGLRDFGGRQCFL
jgi:hypothetical protein